MGATITSRGRTVPWLFFIFHLPGWRASERVTIWRKLQKYGALTWKNAAYILPHTASNLEKLQWLAAEVRKYRGEASVVEVARIEGTSDKALRALFNDARARDYQALIEDTRFALRPSGQHNGAVPRGALARLNRRLGEIVGVDVFACPRRKEAEALLKQLEAQSRQARAQVPAPEARKTSQVRSRTWMTRPRPEVDRVASAWLIRHFIDPRARFVFSSDPHAHPGALRYDMFEGEFTHVGDNCTFEMLLKRFELRDRRLVALAQLVHDADLEDNKFGRPEGRALDLIFKGWGRKGVPDAEILRRGFELYDALYLTLSS